MITVQTGPSYIVQPDQLLNTEVASGLAVNTTVSPFANVPVHGTPDSTVQVNPGVSDDTVPPPPPVELSVSGKVLGWNVAVTFFAPVIVTGQLVPEYVRQPDQDLRMESGPGAAVSVTVSPFATGSVQSPPEPVAQEIPVPVTVPVPVPVAT